MTSDSTSGMSAGVSATDIPSASLLPAGTDDTATSLDATVPDPAQSLNGTIVNRSQSLTGTASAPSC
jgi:hypothetical protein